MIDEISKAIEEVQYKLPKIKFRLLEPMKHHTSIKIGGPVRVMFFPSKPEDMTDLYALLCENGVKPFVMGKGTNLLVKDGTLELAVINTMGLNSLEHTGDMEISAGAGVLLSRLAETAHESGLAGLEFAHGIPGTLGGAVYMNAGAYGGEMKDVVHRTTVFRADTGVFYVTGDEHDFSYRHSRFTDSSDIIISSVLRLKKGDARTIKTKMEELETRRRVSQPLDVPSAGSVFKRPKDGYAASLIEQAGLMGYISGGAQVSEKHAGFIINRGGATFSDVMTVIEHIRETLLKQQGVELELEIRRLE